DGDFEMSARFLSNVTKKYQMQGFIVEESPGNYLRLDIYYTGTQVRVFAASFVNDTPTTRVNQAITANPAGYYLRVVRAGNQWTLAHSANGTNWTTAVSFAHALAVSQAGVFAGNASGSTSPAFTAVVDYVLNPLSPLGAPVYGLTVSTVGSGTVTREPDLAGYPAGTEVTLTAAPAAGWQFAGWSGGLTGTANPQALTINTATSVTATFEETGPDMEPPTVPANIAGMALSSGSIGLSW